MEFMELVMKIISNYVTISDTIKNEDNTFFKNAFIFGMYSFYFTYKNKDYSLYFDINDELIYFHMMNLKTYETKINRRIDNIDKFENIFKIAIEKL